MLFISLRCCVHTRFAFVTTDGARARFTSPEIVGVSYSCGVLDYILNMH